jgi:trimeric autotransporter adhesin
VFVRLVRVTVCFVAAYLIYGAFALAEINAQQLPSSIATATVPRLIQIKGSVRDETGKPLKGNIGVTFTLYQGENDQVAVWQENQTVQLDSAGHYTVLLGATNEGGLPLEIFSAGDARWLGVRPDGQAEQSRILLLSVAYALKAADTEMLGGKPASAYALADNQNSQAQTVSQTGSPNSPRGAQILTPDSGTILLHPNPLTPSCSGITSGSGGATNQIAKFTDVCNIENSVIFESGGNVGIGNTSPAGMLDVSGNTFVRGSLNVLGDAVFPPLGTATTTKSYPSSPLDIEASAYDTALSSATTFDFRWQAVAVGNDTSSPTATLDLLYGVPGDLFQTGITVNSSGILTFATGQTFPGTGSGTVTNVATGSGLTGGPITKTGTISIPAAGVTNSMLANPSITVTAGSGLSGGGPVALGGTVTLTNSAPGLGGTVTSVGSGTGLSGGPITNSGTLSLNTSFTDARYLQLTGGALSGGLTGTTAAFTGGLAATTGTFSSTVSAAGAVMPKTGTATATQGFNSNPLDLQASSFNSTSSSAVTQDFRWMAEPTGNDSSSPSGSLNLLFGAGGSSPTETGLSIASNGLVSFASGQTFPGTGSGTVTSVSTGSGLTGGPITKTGTISIPAAGVTNAMLANPSITVTAGSGLSGGGPVALGGTVTLTNSAPSLGGTVTSVGSGTGLSGGPITNSGTLSLNTSFTDARYLQLTGGALSGGLIGTTAAFTGGLAATTGMFSSTVSAAGAVMPGTGTATATQGFNSNPLDLQASSFNSTSSSAVTQDFRWMAEPTGNDSSSPSGSLNLLFGANGSAPTETGLSIASNGLISFAPGQTFGGGGGGGGVTSVGTGPGLTGGPITTSGTISIATAGVTNSMLANPFITVQAGSGLSGGGTVALGGTVTLASNLSGTPDGIAYFSSPANLISTPAPTNGQMLIGSTGNAPVLGTLTAGQNISITNNPGSVTISAAGGSVATLPFFVTGGARTGNGQAAGHNLNKLWGILLPYNVTTTEITYNVTTADNTANNYDIGIFDGSGNLVVDIGPTPGTTFAPSKIFHTLHWTQGSTALLAGRYYLAFITNCSSSCAAVAAAASYVSFAINVSAGTSQGGALPSTMTPPADTWGSGIQPTVVIQ